MDDILADLRELHRRIDEMEARLNRRRKRQKRRIGFECEVIAGEMIRQDEDPD